MRKFRKNNVQTKFSHGFFYCETETLFESAEALAKPTEALAKLTEALAKPTLLIPKGFNG